MEEIQNIKGRKIICLDFDDCLIPWSDFKNDKNNEESFILEETEKNCKIIKDFIEETGFEPYITSSWSVELDEELNLTTNYRKEFYEKFLNIFKNHFNFIGKDEFDDRVLTIELLLENNNKVIAVDDLDLTHHFEHLENFKMINVVNGNNLKEKLESIKNF